MGLVMRLWGCGQKASRLTPRAPCLFNRHAPACPNFHLPSPIFYGDSTGPMETTLLNGVRQDFKFKKYLVIYLNLFAIFPFFSISRRKL